MCLKNVNKKLKKWLQEKLLVLVKAAKKLQGKSVNESKTNSYNPEVLIEESASKIDQNSINTRCGSTAKRERIENVNIIELSADEVLSDRNE